MANHQHLFPATFITAEEYNESFEVRAFPTELHEGRDIELVLLNPEHKLGIVLPASIYPEADAIRALAKLQEFRRNKDLPPISLNNGDSLHAIKIINSRKPLMPSVIFTMNYKGEMNKENTWRPLSLGTVTVKQALRNNESAIQNPIITFRIAPDLGHIALT